MNSQKNNLFSNSCQLFSVKVETYFKIYIFNLWWNITFSSINSAQQKIRKADRALDIKTFVIVALKIALMSNCNFPYQKNKRESCGLLFISLLKKKWEKVEWIENIRQNVIVVVKSSFITSYQIYSPCSTILLQTQQRFSIFLKLISHRMCHIFLCILS